MAKIKPKSLTCPNCGVAVPVRNVLKAKTVVCRSCDAQIDMSTPNITVLAQLRKQYDSHHGIIPGMKGSLPDGRTCEVVGRLRFEDSDIEETWHWDEWLLLAQDGNYLWLQEDEGRFSLMERFDPQDPPSIQQLNDDWFQLDEESWRVDERGTPRITALQGELTWKATVGDRVHFVDARAAGKAISIEWTSDEIEFFKDVRISRRDALKTCGLDRLLELDAIADDIRAEASKGARSATQAAFIAGGGTALAGLAFFLGSGGKMVAHQYHTAFDTAQLASGVTLLEADLVAGKPYNLHIGSPTVEAIFRKGKITVDTPLTGTFDLVSIDNPLAGGKGRLDNMDIDFIADSSGKHVFKLTGESSSEGAPISGMSVDLSRANHTFDGLVCVAPLFFGLTVLMFIVAAGRKTAAIMKASGEIRKRRAQIITELHEAATVQE